MNKKIIGMIISALIILALVVVMIITNIDFKNTSNNHSEYPSGLIEDLPEDRVDENLDYEAGLETNNPAPNFKLTTLAGETVELADYRGKKVILNFWASWCPPCRVEMPHMENYYQENQETENVEILAVNMNKTERGNKMEEFVDEHKLTFPILVDEKNDITDLYQVMIYPTTYIISTEGFITAKHTGALDEEIIKELVSNTK